MLCVFSNQVKWLVKRHEIIASHDRSPKIIGFLQKRGVVYRRRMCYTQSMEQLWTLLLLGRVWGRHAPTRSLGKLARVWEVKSRMDRKFSRIENLWPRDGSCPLPLRSKPFLGNCFRIVKAQKISRGCAAHVCGSPFAPNAVPAPVLQRRGLESRYHVRTAHAVVKVQLPRKKKIPPTQRSDDFVGWIGGKIDRMCCGAVNLLGMIHGETVFKMNTTTSCGWF